MKRPFKIGDLVTTDYCGKGHVIRKITACDKDLSCGSGWAASADGGEVYPHCGRSEANIIGVDAAWFVKVTDAPTKS